MKHLRKSYILLFAVLLSVTTAFSVPEKTVTPKTALMNYLNNKDKTFDWRLEKSVRAEGLTIYQIVFTSQQWRGINWRHELIVMAPENVKCKDALLFITGGGNKDEQPRLHNLDDGLIKALGQIAVKNQAVTSIIWQVPNQPLFDDLTEDALISYTLHNFQNDGDFTWPLLFPMTKSAIRAMDVIQKFSKKELKLKVTHFVVSGGSKRGWTTWLTGASDSRIKAIAPMVIDVLNMPVNVDYQKKVWGDYSIQIEDYVKLGIAQQMSSSEGSEIVAMVDPYSYRKNLTMPKMIFIGTNDEYWPVDAVKNYIDSIPGNNHLCYIPNAGHDLGDKTQALNTLSAFFGTTITDRNYPECRYTLNDTNGKISLAVTTSPEKLSGAALWSAVSTDRDFRDEKWSSTPLNSTGINDVKVEMEHPDKGYKAFYIELKYKAPFNQEYTECTRMFVSDKNRVFLKAEQ